MALPKLMPIIILLLPLITSLQIPPTNFTCESSSSSYSSILSPLNLSDVSDQLDGMSIEVELFRSSIMLAKVAMGTFHDAEGNPYYMSNRLLVDTGSSVTWTQCSDCDLCYEQEDPLFDNKDSSSYTPILMNDQPLEYTIEYNDGASSTGVLAMEMFTFQFQPMQLVFGCGKHNVDKLQSPKYEIDGVMGLGINYDRFCYPLVKQLEPISGGKFSYCSILKSPDDSDSPTLFLRFGSHIKPPESLQKTKLVSLSQYSVVVKDLGLDGTQFNLPAELLPNAPCRIDSGTDMSRINDQTYSALVSELRNHFTKFPEFTAIEVDGYECFHRDGQKGFTPELPSLEFYFQDAGGPLTVPQQGVFVRTLLKDDAELFCLFIQPDTQCVVGAYQQANTKFIFDTKNAILEFGADDCLANG